MNSFPATGSILVFGASSDHPLATRLQELLPMADEAILTQSRHPRAAALRC